MAGPRIPRTYGSQYNCPIAKSLDIVGERWTILILRDLAFGVTKFKEILKSLDGIPSNLLARRLQRLEDQGIVERSFYSKHPPRAEYRLTTKGLRLIPLLRSLAEWGTWYELSKEQKQNPIFVGRMAWIGGNREPPEIGHKSFQKRPLARTSSARARGRRTARNR
jgi:DNA-binding HxlR family transcriptional regulator